MADTDGKLMKRVLEGMFDGIATANALVSLLIDKRPRVDITDGGTAATAVTESPVTQVSGPALLTAATFTAPIAVTADATNRLTVTVSKRTAGGAATVMATGTTTAGGLGSLTAFVPVTIPLSTVAGAVALANGDEITVLVSKQGSGVAFAAATSFATVELRLEPQ